MLPKIPDNSIDMVLTDLPYGTTPCKWDTLIDLTKLWKEYTRIIKQDGAMVFTSSQPFTTTLIQSNIEMFKYCWVWVKSCGAGFLNAKNAPLKLHEDICVFSKGTIANKSNKRMKYYPQGIVPISKPKKPPAISDTIGTRPCRVKPYVSKFKGFPTSILKFSNDKDKIHPTQKPIGLFEYLIKTYTKEGDWVHDSCVGCGTTINACANLNRNCVCFEISNEWEHLYKKAQQKRSYQSTL